MADRALLPCFRTLLLCGGSGPIAANAVVTAKNADWVCLAMARVGVNIVICTPLLLVVAAEYTNVLLIQRP